MNLFDKLRTDAAAEIDSIAHNASDFAQAVVAEAERLCLQKIADARTAAALEREREDMLLESSLSVKMNVAVSRGAEKMFGEFLDELKRRISETIRAAFAEKMSRLIADGSALMRESDVVVSISEADKDIFMKNEPEIAALLAGRDVRVQSYTTGNFSSGVIVRSVSSPRMVSFTADDLAARHERALASLFYAAVTHE